MGKFEPLMWPQRPLQNTRLIILSESALFRDSDIILPKLTPSTDVFLCGRTQTQRQPTNSTQKGPGHESIHRLNYWGSANHWADVLPHERIIQPTASKAHSWSEIKSTTSNKTIMLISYDWLNHIQGCGKILNTPINTELSLYCSVVVPLHGKCMKICVVPNSDFCFGPHHTNKAWRGLFKLVSQCSSEYLSVNSK